MIEPRHARGWTDPVSHGRCYAQACASLAYSLAGDWTADTGSRRDQPRFLVPTPQAVLPTVRYQRRYSTFFSYCTRCLSRVMLWSALVYIRSSRIDNIGALPPNNVTTAPQWRITLRVVSSLVFAPCSPLFALALENSHIAFLSNHGRKGIQAVWPQRSWSSNRH